MAITFMGYIDNPEELLRGARRCLFLCDGSADTANLPTTAGFTLADGSRTAPPAPGSMALVVGGAVQTMKSDKSWGAL